MSTAQPVAAGESRVIPLTARHRRGATLSRRIVKAATVFGFCLLGLIGSFADSAVARTGLLLVDGTGDPGADVTATLVWATIANLAACAGVVMVAYWLLTRPSAQIVELNSRRPKR
ncbi:MAG TPA: hypothetical protein VGF92_14865 [Stellaceae bacterium]|jgi:hypothetical protein